MRVCPKCGEDVPKDKQYCQKCLFNMGFFEYFGYEQPGEGRIGQRFDHLHPKYLCVMTGNGQKIYDLEEL